MFDQVRVVALLPSTIVALAPHGVEVVWLTGSLKKMEREKALAKISSGKAALAIGTVGTVADTGSFPGALTGQSAMYESPETRAEVLRENIGDDLFNGRRQLETKVAARKTSEQSVELALETVELVRVQYEAGQATQIDLLTAQDNLVSAREALAQAQRGRLFILGKMDEIITEGKTLFLKFNTGPSGHGMSPAAGEALALAA